jgi:hypothetical protein
MAFMIITAFFPLIILRAWICILTLHGRDLPIPISHILRPFSHILRPFSHILRPFSHILRPFLGSY